jgi:phage terminase large subunit-like protein
VTALAEIRARLTDPSLDEREARMLIEVLSERVQRVRAAAWTPYPWQTPPGPIPTHGAWLMLGGRGTGKTEGAARYMDRHANGPPCDPRIPGGHRMSIVAPTIGDAMEACVDGPSGLHTINPAVRARGGTGGTHVVWPNRSRARLFGCYTREDVERLRAGGNRCLIWIEEVAAQRYLGEALEHTAMGLRIGPRPHYVMSTTPKPRMEIRELMKRSDVLITRGRTAEAIHLAAEVRKALMDRYAGTRIGRQELDAEVLDDVEGALWTFNSIEHTRIRHFNRDNPWGSLTFELAQIREWTGRGVEDYTTDRRPWRTVIAVDPPGETAECGIVAVAAPRNGRAGKDHAVVLADRSLAATPEMWGSEVVKAYHDYDADLVVVEKNQGGDMVRSTIHNVDSTVNVEKLTARGSKEDRAEPVSVLYAKGWVHHVGVLPGLESQQTTWVPAEGKSPDRIDALVHGITYVLNAARSGVASLPNQHNLAAQRL